MSWKLERDTLIAQTLAFVQSVTGKPEETGRPEDVLLHVPQPEMGEPEFAPPPSSLVFPKAPEAIQRRPTKTIIWRCPLRNDRVQRLSNF